jgi:hypothetical protein
MLRRAQSGFRLPNPPAMQKKNVPVLDGATATDSMPLSGAL